MAQQKRISITIPQQTHDDVMQHIADIKSLLKPFLQTITIDDRETLFKMGDKSQPFVQKALDYVKLNNDFLTPTVDVAGWQNDFDAWEDLVPVKNQLTQLVSDLDDTIMLLGSEAYSMARSYYDLAKLAAHRGDSSAKPIVEDLGKRFHGNKRKNPVVSPVV